MAFVVERETEKNNKPDPIETIEQIQDNINNHAIHLNELDEMDTNLVSTSWDTDFRICEIEWFLEDFVNISGTNIVKGIKNPIEFMKGGRNVMALSRFEQAKIMILGGAYDRPTLEKQLKRYQEKGMMTKDEVDTLFSLMDAQEMVSGQ